jgi:glycosyltransferase involved in cell wall biosynthesis
MRIALVSVQTELTPPSGYGAVGRIVENLANCLSGHAEVTVVASEGSTTQHPLLPIAGVGRRGSPDPLALESHRSVLQSFDVIHNHDPSVAAWLCDVAGSKVVTTPHTNRSDLPSGRPHAFVSYSQARLLRYRGFAGWSRPVVEVDAEQSEMRRSDYLLVLGQVRPEKGIEEACRLGRLAGRPVLLAGPLARHNVTWFETTIRSRYSAGDVVHVGEVHEPDRSELIRRAAALVFLPVPPEPLGLVMLEAIANGTPVLARPEGACGEIVDHGVNGFLARTVDELALLADRLGMFSRKSVRESLSRYSAEAVAAEHLSLYRRVLHGTWRIKLSARQLSIKSSSGEMSSEDLECREEFRTAGAGDHRRGLRASSR